MINQLLHEQQKGYIGSVYDLKMILCACLNYGHVLLEGPPGLGKTKLANTISETLGGTFNRIQFTPDLLPSDVTGIKFFHPGTQSFEIKQGPIFTNVLLADEINRATPKTQSSLLQAMQEQQVTIDDTTFKLPDPFIVLATQNPLDHQQGTFQLPEAQMDRFMIRIFMGYPSFEDEIKIISGHYQERVHQVLESTEAFQALRQQTNEIFCHEDLYKYITYIVHQTRTDQEIIQGLSPRAGIHIVGMSKAFALINGRDYVIPDDVREVVPYIAVHRMTYRNARLSEGDKLAMMNRIIGEIDVPAL
ncbi:AAA family ATPase [Macrococcus lamae]|uniref:MoxR family ATPase n=1 Tax=Macrococcus lamae TaxID=198484 RepID=A0A4R6BSJ3_9STAP|nr:MoxR family ATPase [Macrococcus lamae]TDM07117.1 MoxR family ATPase [Macrococcus lamae]